MACLGGNPPLAWSEGSDPCSRLGHISFWSRQGPIPSDVILRRLSFKILVVSQERETASSWRKNAQVRVTQVDRLSQAPEPSSAYDLVILSHPFVPEEPSVTVRQFFPTPSAPAPLILVFAKDVACAREEFQHLEQAFVKSI